MNVMLLLASFLVVLGCCGTFSSAKKSNSFKSSLKKISNGIVERDLSSFQQQINAATYLDITSCSSFPCVDSTYSSYCDGICKKDASLFQQVATKIQNCYVQGICGQHLLSNQLTNINISIAPGSYPGSCYLTGQAVTMALTDQSVTTQTSNQANNNGLSYAYVSLTYTFTGLNLHCQPAAQAYSCSGNGGSNSGSNGGGSGSSGGQNVGIPCCGNDLLTSLVCLVQQIVGTLGTQLNLLACNCYCGGGRKREVEGATLSKRQMATSAIDSAVTVTQVETFEIDYLLIYDNSVETITGNYVDTQVSFSSAIPSQYQADLTAGIASVFNDYNVFYYLQYNFYNTQSDLIIYFFGNTCNTCK